MFPYEVVGYVDVLRSKIVDRVLIDVDARGIMHHNHYGNSITELYVWIAMPDYLTRCCGKCHIFCFSCGRGNGLLFPRERGYSTTILHKSITRYGTTGITTRSLIRVTEGDNGQRN